MEWILKAIQREEIKKINDLKQFEEMKNKKKSFVYYYGSENHPRFKIFAEGHYTFTSVDFIYSDCPYIA